MIAPLHIQFSDSRLIEGAIGFVALAYFATVWPGVCDLIVLASAKKEQDATPAKKSS